MKRILKVGEWCLCQPASWFIACALGGVTSRRMGEQRDDHRERIAEAKLWLQVARWQRALWGLPIFKATRLFVWNGSTHRYPVLP